MNRKLKKVLENQQENYIMPFLWLHGETEETLRTYMKAIYDSKIRAVCVESRPHPDFCGPAWWRDLDIILDEAKKREMKVWILDDSHFPTGYANGQVKTKPDSMRRQSVVHRIFRRKAGETLELSAECLQNVKPQEKNEIETYLGIAADRVFTDDRLLGITAFRQDAPGEEIDLMDQIDEAGNLHWVAPDGNWKIYVVQLSRNYGYHRDYINMLQKDSCHILLEAVYEPHYEHYAKYFGTVIAGFFSDEPELGNGHIYEMENTLGTDSDFPWSEELEKELKKRWGDEFSRKLPYLWENEAGVEQTASVRYQYMDALTNLVKKNFSMQIGTWCRAHQVQYIGHLIEDDGHHSRTGSSLGHFFRGMAGQDMAGIDDIGGQVFPGGEEICYNRGIFEHRNGEFYHYTLGKLASSYAAIDARKKGNSMCEIFGNYGWKEGLRLEKYLADHFMVRGINHFVPHAFSAKEFPDPDCPPHFYAHGHNPQYRHFGSLMQYMNRVCELLSDGKHCAPVAVLYDGEGDWIGKEMRTDPIGHCLADHQIEYDIIPEDAVRNREDYDTTVQNGKLIVGKQEYQVLVVPYREMISVQLAERLLQLTDQGVSVAFAEQFPVALFDETGRLREEQNVRKERAALFDTVRSKIACVPTEKLVSWLEERKTREIRLEPANQRVRYLHYLHTDGTELYFLVNEGKETYEGTICLQRADLSGKDVAGYDPWTNQLVQLDGDGAEYRILLEAGHSRMLLVDKKDGFGAWHRNTETVSTLLKSQKIRMKFLQPWFRSTVQSIDYPHFEKKIQVTLPDRIEEEQPKFSGIVRYENTFKAEKTDSVILEITDAGESVEVLVNQRSLGVQVVPPFVYDLTGYLCDGENHLTIEIATTLERQLAAEYDYFGKPLPAPTSHSGINGTVFLTKLV